MTTISLQDGLNKFTSLTYPLIKTTLQQPPYTLSTAQMPLAFFRYASLERSQPSLTFKSGLVNCTAEFVVIIDASRQNLQNKNYEIVREIMEGIVNVWELNSLDLQVIDYTLKESTESVDNTTYYSVVAEVSFGL